MSDGCGSNKENPPLRFFAALVISVLFQLSPSHAQTAGPRAAGDLSLPLDPLDQDAPDQGQFDFSNGFTRVAIISIDDLPPDVKMQAERIVAQTTADDLRALQNSIDGSQQATAALTQNGLNSSQVIAANVDGDGTLTLVIQTTT